MAEHVGHDLGVLRLPLDRSERRVVEALLHGIGRKAEHGEKGLVGACDLCSLALDDPEHVRVDQCGQASATARQLLLALQQLAGGLLTARPGSRPPDGRHHRLHHQIDERESAPVEVVRVVESPECGAEHRVGVA